METTGAAYTYVTSTPAGHWVVVASGPFAEEAEARQYADWLVNADESEFVTLQ